MSSFSQNNKRIAINTLLMYIRMFITMVVGLYTSRVVLQTLGVVDYGLYNVVGGIVTMFTFINGAMVNATTRFITFYLGKKDNDMLNTVFNMASVVHLSLGFAIVVLGETVGLWFLYNKMQIPPDRMRACFWLLQFSIATTFLNILYVPYNACVIAHEKMSAFAYISIMDVFLKLGIVLSLQWVTLDRLIVYGFLLSCISVINLGIYFIYCKRSFPESKLRRIWDKSLFKEMLSFAGWGLFGNFSYVFYSQGINILLNMFCGPAANAARAIAVQVEGVVTQFSVNVQTAVNPQIIKSYSQNELERMKNLIFASSKICFFLILLFSAPIALGADFILRLWLGTFPEHTINFLRLTFLMVLLETLINPMFTANLATGKVAVYNKRVALVSLSFIPITFVAIKFTLIPEIVFICNLLRNITGVTVRIFIMRKQLRIGVIEYFRHVLLRILFVMLLSLLIPVVFYSVYGVSGAGTFVCCSVITVICIISVTYAVGLDKNERTFIVAKCKSFVLSRLRHA